jgi:lipopolysaccharide export LptBFGC system permease protein LptF
MKKIKITLLAIFGFALLSFTIQESSIFQAELEDVGIIRQSLLKPIQFNKTQKGTWVLLNGQEINKESELFKLLEENFDLNILNKKENKYYLPNASGAFIRSSNVNGEGMDPNKDRLVGSLQKDELKSHSHSYNSDKSTHRASKTGNERKSVPTSEDGINRASTSNTGASETRPVNISMYTYIKISN